MEKSLEPYDDLMPVTLPHLERMRAIDGWLEPDEGDLLLAAARASLRKEPGALVEIGSYCGRSTVLLGAAVRERSDGAKVFAIDPHEGVVGATEQGLRQTRPTFEEFTRNIHAAGLDDWVVPIRCCSHEADWRDPIALLFIDGLHDRDSVARDFRCFANHVRQGGFVAFHDYAAYYPGVIDVVDGILAGDGWRRVAHVRSLTVIQRDNGTFDGSRP